MIRLTNPKSGHILSLIGIYNLQKREPLSSKAQCTYGEILLEFPKLHPSSPWGNKRPLDPDSQLFPFRILRTQEQTLLLPDCFWAQWGQWRESLPKACPGWAGWAGARFQDCRPSLHLTHLLFGANAYLCRDLLRLPGPGAANPIPILARLMWGTVLSLSYFNASCFLPDCSVLHMSKT